MTGAYGADPPQSLIDEQLAHMIDPELDEFVEEVRHPLKTLCCLVTTQSAPAPSGGSIFCCLA
jgi:hypothetical protein